MDARINYTLQDSNSLDETITKHKDKMVAGGFEEVNHQSLKDLRQDLALKETAQEKADAKVDETTTAQNKVLEDKRRLVGLAKTSAKSAYGKDPATLKLFRVGEDIPRGVSKLSATCDYLSGMITERKTDFLKNGFTQQMIDNLTSGRVDIDAADKLQEDAKKARKSATLERDAAFTALKDRMYRIRNFAKTCFAENPEVLVEFDPIPKGRGGGTTPPPPENPAKPV